MEALFVKENFNIRWFAQAGFVENINSILKEYKQSRRLLVTITTSYLSFWFKQSTWGFGVITPTAVLFFHMSEFLNSRSLSGLTRCSGLTIRIYILLETCQSNIKNFWVDTDDRYAWHQLNMIVSPRLSVTEPSL